MPRPRLRRLTLAAAFGAAGALALAACSSSPSSPSDAQGSASTTSSQPSSVSPGTGGTGTAAISPIPAAQQSAAGTAGTAPTVTVPSGSPPTVLESADLITGSGAAAAPGSTVTVQYVLADYATGKVLQSSWTSQPYSFTLGEGRVIPGWDKGIVGMKAGGRRELIIPPNLAYGPNGGQGIPPNDTLVFVVDVLKVG
jgi:peptidylprolyl isomerase